MAEGPAHNAFKNAVLQPVGVNVRHICWTWYCSDRFRMERWSREYNTFETNKQTNKGKKKKNGSRMLQTDIQLSIFFCYSILADSLYDGWERKTLVWLF